MGMLTHGWGGIKEFNPSSIVRVGVFFLCFCRISDLAKKSRQLDKTYKFATFIKKSKKKKKLSSVLFFRYKNMGTCKFRPKLYQRN